MTRFVFAALAALLVASTPQTSKPVCKPDNVGLTLPSGFCALLVAESIGPHGAHGKGNSL